VDFGPQALIFGAKLLMNNMLSCGL
jgi:hypothetical protein